MNGAATQRIPLAPAQRGIYFLHRLAPDSAVYNVPIALRVRGPLSLDRLQRAVDALLARHEALRTTFVEEDFTPLQVIHLPQYAPRVTVKVAGVAVEPGGDPAAAATAEAERRASVPFDLARGPLWRVDVVPVGPDDHAITMTFDHIIFDEASVPVLARDFKTAYEQPDALPAVDPERGYAECCRAELIEPDPQSLAYWRENLRGAGTKVLPHDLPAAPSNAAALFDGERLRFTVDDSTAQRLPAFCTAHRVSAFMVFQAAFAAVLHGWTGESDILMGIALPGRAGERFAETVGYFQNTVVLRTEVNPEQSFADLLRRARRAVLGALQHRRTPFEAMVEAVRPARAATRNPLFQAALAYNRVRIEREWELDGFAIEPLLVEWPITQFDLNLFLQHDAGGILCEITYDSGRFRRTTMLRLAGVFVDLLAAVVAEPERTVAELPRLRPAAVPPDPARTDPWATALCGIFGTVLGAPAVELDDDFFALGGDSRLAAQVIAAARSTLDAGADLRHLFEAPTPAGLAARLRAARGTGVPSRPARTTRIPLSYAQRGLWYQYQLEGPSPAYNVPLMLRFPDPVDEAALGAAVEDLVARHESLRTVFARLDGEACQVVRGRAEHGVRMRVVATTDEKLDAELRDAARYAFDLAAEAPVQATLFTAPGGDVLLLLLHQIACDNWSSGRLRRDLNRAYAARCAGAAPDWEPLPAQYADYALWQQAKLGTPGDPGSLAAQQARFWRTALADLPEELTLPSDRPRPPVCSYRGGTVSVDWDADLHTALVDLARASGTTLFMVLQAGLAALLSRLGSGTDIPLGTPTGWRGHEAYGDLVGAFGTTIVLRTDVSGDPTFRELLHRVRRADLAAYAAADLPFDSVVAAVNPARTSSRHPLFQVMLALHGDPEAERYRDHGTARLDLSVDLVDAYREDGAPAGIRGTVEYAADLFDATTVEAIAARLATLLRLAAADPGHRVSTLDILAPDERRWLMAASTGAHRAVPAISLPDLVARQAARTPDATAVMCGPTALTYADLCSRVNQLARLLIERGVGAETLVAVALPPSADLVVALLGVLSAGGVYVYVDPDGDKRTGDVISDVDTFIVGVDAPPWPVPEDRLLVMGAQTAAGDPDRDIGPAERRPATMADAAYVSFGSADQPNGVVIEHGQLASHLAYAADAYPGAAGTVLVPASSTMDPAALAPLTAGGTVRIADINGSATHQPSLLRVAPNRLPLLADLPAAAPTGELVLRGEALFGGVLRGWRRLHPLATVVNEYGPAETTAGCVAYRIEPGRPVAGGSVPIGRPVCNTRVYVLDAALRPVPAGVPGEIYVGGAQVGRGYLNRPAATAQRFLPDPFGPPGSRMYRTGDVGRFDPSGDLLHLGRSDDQVTIRGVRVNPGEVAAVLAEHPWVADVRVVVDPEPRLVAYVVPTGFGVTDDELRAYLAGRLPPALIPAAFVRLAELPLTTDGRVDRSALPPAPVATHRTGRRPGTPTEVVLHRLFARVLGRPAVGVDDDFFAVGGHSLLAVRLTTLIGRELAVGVPVGRLIARPTVAALAAEVDAIAKADKAGRVPRGEGEVARA